MPDALYNAVLITGANRGLGLAMARAFLDKDHKVVGTYRSTSRADDLFALQSLFPQQFLALECDVSSDESVLSFQGELEKQVRSLDILINNAGQMPRGENAIEKMDALDFLGTLNVNAMGAMRLTKACLPLVRAGRQKKLVHISSIMGSLGRNASGRSYSYRVSKCALNMMSRNLAIELRFEKILSLVLHPGWVRTEMGGAGAEITPEKAAAHLVSFILSCNLEKHTGGFFDYRGLEIPW